MSEDMDGQVIHREFAVDLEASGDGRTLDLRVVPYNTVARVADPPTYEPYDEMWLPGVFDKQRDAAHRVLVNFEHQQGVAGVVGRGVSFSDTDSGFEGTFRMLSQQDADKALELVNEGVLSGVSLEAKPLKSIRENGVVKRVKAHLENIALCRQPAFEGAQVLAVREAPEEEYVPEPVVLNAEADERLARMGFAPLASRSVATGPLPPRERYEDDQWARACLSPDRLPVLDPDGAINLGALQRVTRDVVGSRVSMDPAEKGNAARRLVRYHTAAKLDVPDALRNVARWL